MTNAEIDASPSRTPILVGMNGRFFPNKWRPVLDEIAFADEAGFAALQLPGKPKGLGERHLGAPLREVGKVLTATRLTATMEIPILVGREGRTVEGLTPTKYPRPISLPSPPCAVPMLIGKG